MRELLSLNPYIVRYQVIGADVVVLPVRHAARRPTDP